MKKQSRFSLITSFRGLKSWDLLRAGAVLFAAGSLFFSDRSFGLTSEQTFEFNQYSSYRRINQEGFSTLKNSNELYVRAGYSLGLAEGYWQFNFRPELRGVRGPSLDVPKIDMARVTVRSQNRYLDLQHQFHEKGEWVADIERLDLAFSDGTFSAYVGRRPVRLGVMALLPIWDRMTLPYPTVMGPTWVSNPDGYGANYRFGAWKARIQGIETRSNSDRVQQIGLGYETETFGIEAMGGEWWEQSVVGGTAKATALGYTVRGEMMWIGLRSGDSDSQVQMGWGIDKNISEKSKLSFEFLFQNAGFDKSYSLVAPSRFMRLQGRHYGMLSWDQSLTDAWQLTASTLVNLGDGSVLASLKTGYGFGDNWQVYTEAKVPKGQREDEFSSQTIYLGDHLYRGTSTLVAAGVNLEF